MTRQSIPTADMEKWMDAGWLYVMPDFDTPDHSFVIWPDNTTPRVPAVNRVPETDTENANERSKHRTQLAG